LEPYDNGFFVSVLFPLYNENSTYNNNKWLRTRFPVCALIFGGQFPREIIETVSSVQSAIIIVTSTSQKLEKKKLLAAVIYFNETIGKNDYTEKL